MLLLTHKKMLVAAIAFALGLSAILLSAQTDLLQGRFRLPFLNGSKETIISPELGGLNQSGQEKGDSKILQCSAGGHQWTCVSRNGADCCATSTPHFDETSAPQF